MSSQSDASQSSSQASYDNRIGAENSVVVAHGGAYTINFPEQAVSVISKVLDFSGQALSKAASIADQSVQNTAQTNQALISSNNAAVSQAQLGNSSLIKDLIPVMFVGVVGLVVFFTFRKRGKIWPTK
jgi:hypothetical protein